MLRFTVRDLAMVFAAALVVVVVAVLGIVFSIATDWPGSKASSVYRGLHGIGEQMEKRDQEIEALEPVSSSGETR
jgi:hypothetical protein